MDVTLSSPLLFKYAQNKTSLNRLITSNSSCLYQYYNYHYSHYQWHLSHRRPALSPKQSSCDCCSTFWSWDSWLSDNSLTNTQISTLAVRRRDQPTSYLVKKNTKPWAAQHPNPVMAFVLFCWIFPIVSCIDLFPCCPVRLPVHSCLDLFLVFFPFLFFFYFISPPVGFIPSLLLLLMFLISSFGI